MVEVLSRSSKKQNTQSGLRIQALNDARLTERIRVLLDYCLPVKYSDNFYNTYIRSGLHSYNQLAFYHDLLIGCISCRMEFIQENEYRLYILTIAVLEPYRRMGIGSRLLETILNNVSKETQHRIVEIRLHMQVGSPAQSFYEKFGFEVVREEKDYYSDLNVRDALLMSLVVPQPHFKAKKPPKA